MPAGWPSLEYMLHWRGTELRVAVTQTEFRIDAGEGDAVDFAVRGVPHRIEGGQSVVVPLVDQGPVREGRPRLGEIAEARREDGTLLSASVPDPMVPFPLLETVGEVLADDEPSS